MPVIDFYRIKTVKIKKKNSIFQIKLTSKPSKSGIFFN